MSLAETEEPNAHIVRRPKGPVTARHQRRAALIYVAVFAAGLTLIMRGDTSMQTLGIGLWFPGGGFLAGGDVTSFLGAIALFGLAVLAWFWAGMVIAPVAIWLGAALAAASTATGPVAVSGQLAVLGVMAAVIAAYGVGDAIRERLNARTRARRNETFPQSLAEVRERTTKPIPEERELDADQLAALRYVYDRALQPIDQFGGFNIIEQFQPAALRYQLNHMGFALGVAQCAYLPNFSGYLAEAQNNLIQKYLLRRVWSYWIYESIWGHLNIKNFDPAARDNIMLTGWFGVQVGQYMTASGDGRYAQPSSLAFKLNRRTTYAHDFHTLIGSIVENYAHYADEFCLYPCEPNWIYPLCNHYGMAALAAHDHLFGTEYVRHILPHWRAKLEAEFTDSSGSIIGLRSKHLGLEFPFPSWEADTCRFANCFDQDFARTQWAIARKDLEPRLKPNAAGKLRIKLPGPGADPGNYGIGHGVGYCAHLIAAQEFGDTEIAEAAQRSLDEDCGLETKHGIRRYLKASNLINAQTVLGAIMRTGDFRRSVVEGPSPQTRLGPILESATYPDVLVARAVSNGQDLDLVLHGSGTQTLKLARLAPGQRYGVNGTQDFTASTDGCASLVIALQGRTAVKVSKREA
jgi:hypothetical protein